jgi:hypothetical protein
MGHLPVIINFVLNFEERIKLVKVILVGYHCMWGVSFFVLYVVNKFTLLHHPSKNKKKSCRSQPKDKYTKYFTLAKLLPEDFFCFSAKNIPGTHYMPSSVC